MTHPIPPEQLDEWERESRWQSDYFSGKALPALIRAYRAALAELRDLRQAVESANFAARHHYETLTANLAEYEKLRATIAQAKREASINTASQLACDFFSLGDYNAGHVCDVRAKEIEQGLHPEDETFAIEQANLWREAKAKAKREGAREAIAEELGRLANKSNGARWCDPISEYGRGMNETRDWLAEYIKQRLATLRAEGK